MRALGIDLLEPRRVADDDCEGVIDHPPSITFEHDGRLQMGTLTFKKSKHQQWQSSAGLGLIRKDDVASLDWSPDTGRKGERP